jgi:hypothetical protein
VAAQPLQIKEIPMMKFAQAQSRSKLAAGILATFGAAMAFSAPAHAACPDPSGTAYAYSTAQANVVQPWPGHVGPAGGAGVVQFAGGKVLDSFTVNYADTGAAQDSASGSYTVQADCSVTTAMTVTAGYDAGGTYTRTYYFADGGRMFHMIQTDQYRIATGTGNNLSSGPVANFNPQPEPPGRQGAIPYFNPQPDPPGRPIPYFNPQPEPPGRGQ